MTACSEILEPLDQSELIRVSNLPNINFTNQDFSSMKSRLITYSKDRFADKFSDFVESDLGIMLIENVAFVGDTLSFKQDQNINEVFIDSVTELENAFRLARLVGFRPVPPIGATAMFSLSLSGALTTDMVIPAGIAVDTVSNGEPITFELFQADDLKNPLYDEPIVIQAGNIANTSVIGIQGSTRVDSFIGTNEANQVVTLGEPSILFESIRVDVDGIRWEQVESFTDSQPRNEFRVEFTSTYQAYVIFGNGIAGRIPSLGSTIEVTYRIGGGTIGNVIANFINIQRGFAVPGLNFSAPITITNYTKGSHGYNGDTIDDIRRKLPAYIKTQDRAVTGEDYKTLADQFATDTNGQIGKATAVLRNHGCAGNIIDIFILARDGADGLTEASSELKLELSEEIEDKKMINHHICIRDGVIVTVDVTVDVTIDKFYRKFKQEIEAKVVNRIKSFFSLVNWEYGQALKDNELIKYISDIKEIKNATATFVTDDIENEGQTISVSYYEIIRYDNINVTIVFE